MMRRKQFKKGSGITSFSLGVIALLSPNQ